MDETLSFRQTLQPWVIPAAVGIVSFFGGIGVGWQLRQRRFKNHIQWLEAMVVELANQDRVDANNMTAKYDTGDKDFDKALEEEDSVAIVGDGGERIRVISSRPLSSAPPRPDPTDDDVPHQKHPSLSRPMERLEMDKDWNWEAELSTRTDTAPYILHKDEFMNDEMGFDQDTWTYYKGDDILVDETDTPVYNFHENTGPLTFGHGSGDPSVVYIRNEDLKAEYEVVLNDGYYSVEILGLELEEKMATEDLKHSTIQKFRDRD